MSDPRAVDVSSLEANHRGQLSRSQRTFVYRVGIRWVITAMFLAATGLLAVYAVGNIWFTILGLLVILSAAAYLVSRSLDCIVDSSQNRVAAVSGSATPRPVGTLGFPFSGWREDGWEQFSVGRLDFWVPPSAIAMSVEGEISVYFAPRSRVVVNVELGSLTAAVGGSEVPAKEEDPARTL
jgi:hypothetical protein